MSYPTPTEHSAGGIDATRARTVASRLRALEAAGYRLTEGHLWVLRCCERRVARSLAAAQPIEVPA